jgi:hypothetical protein
MIGCKVATEGERVAVAYPGISLHQIRKNIEYTFEDTGITDLPHRFSECGRVTPSGRLNM